MAGPLQHNAWCRVRLLILVAGSFSTANHFVSVTHDQSFLTIDVYALVLFTDDWAKDWGRTRAWTLTHGYISTC